MSTPSDGPAPQTTDETTTETTTETSTEASAETIGGDVIGAAAEGANTTEKDPDAWVTGDEDMTGAQRSYLDTLAREAGETLPATLTKAEASQHIDRLQSKTGRGDS